VQNYYFFSIYASARVFFLKKDVCCAKGRPCALADIRRVWFILKDTKNIVSYIDFIGFFSLSYLPS
jgi:hypothetical protein